jgi:hypothetical protein
VRRGRRSGGRGKHCKTTTVGEGAGELRCPGAVLSCVCDALMPLSWRAEVERRGASGLSGDGDGLPGEQSCRWVGGRLELAVDERSMGTAAEGEIDIFRSSVLL